MVRHALRTMIEAQDVAVVEVADGEAALAELAFRRFDLLVLEVDLPKEDGISVVLMHRLLLANQLSRVAPPDIVFALAPEVRANASLTDELQKLGIAGLIDDSPRSDVARLVESILQARAAVPATGKPAAA
jgi:DNA-binding NarL/FixJ family response regulator